MIDLSDLSVIIPYRFDFIDRENNLKAILRYFEKFFTGYEIIILESAPVKKGAFLEEYPNIRYSYEKSDGLLHRTKMLNDGAKSSTRSYVSLYDTDVVFHPEAVRTTIKKLREGSPFVFPYNGVVLALEKPHDWFVGDFEFSSCPVLPKGGHRGLVGTRYGAKSNFVYSHFNSDGGATFFNRDLFLEFGGYNEKFISWGWEDNEIVTRFTKLGYPPIKIDGANMIHLEHKRGEDSSRSHAQYLVNQREWSRVVKMNKLQLERYIQNELLK